MKKLALCAMLLCSCFLIGCQKKETKPETKPGDEKPAATSEKAPGAAPAGETK